MTTSKIETSKSGEMSIEERIGAFMAKMATKEGLEIENFEP